MSKPICVIEFSQLIPRSNDKYDDYDGVFAYLDIDMVDKIVDEHHIVIEDYYHHWQGDDNVFGKRVYAAFDIPGILDNKKEEIKELLDKCVIKQYPIHILMERY